MAESSFAFWHLPDIVEHTGGPVRVFDPLLAWVSKIPERRINRIAKMTIRSRRQDDNPIQNYPKLSTQT